MVRPGRRIVDHAGWIHVDFTDESALDKQLQRVVDGRFGNSRTIPVNLGENLIGGQMLRLAQHDLADFETLFGRRYPARLQQPDQFFLSQGIVPVKNTMPALYVGPRVQPIAAATLRGMIVRKDQKLTGTDRLPRGRRNLSSFNLDAVDNFDSYSCHKNGMTLLELLVALSITVIVTAAALPYFGNLLADQRRTSTLNGLVHAVHFARSEAAKRGRDAVLCASADSRSCSGNGDGWQRGWIIFVNGDRDRPPVVDPGEPVLIRNTGNLAATLAGNRSAFVFRPFGKRATNGTLVYCDRRREASARALVISYTGRPRVAPEGPAGRALACPPPPQ